MMRHDNPRVLMAGALLMCCSLGMVAGWASHGYAQQGSETARDAHIVRLPLPLDARTVEQVLQILERLAETTQPVARPEDRPLVILQFGTDRGQTGAGSSFTDCHRLARFLISPAAQRLRIVGYVPGLIDRFGPGPGDPQAHLVGHAVLIAIMTEELILDQTVQMGDATIDEPVFDLSVNNIYRDMASMRLTLPVSLVKSMVDPQETLHVVTTIEGERLVSREELLELEREGKAIQSETLAVAGKTARYTADVFDRFSINVHRISERQQLAVRYGIDLSAIEAEVAQARDWRAVRYEFPDYITEQSVAWAIRALENDLRNDAVNLILLSFESTGGELNTCLKLAKYLSDFDPEKVRTVAFLPRTASGPAALAALACDHLILTEDSQLGGMYDPELSDEDIDRARIDLERIARAKERDLALYLAMLKPQLELVRIRNVRTGQLRWLTGAEWVEWNDKELWAPLDFFDTRDGILPNRAEADRIARVVLADWQQVESFYQLSEPAKVLTPTGVDQFINWLAGTLASPAIAFLLLFGGMFLISTEMSSPGLGVPGFLGTLCFVLFFWSQHLGGTAGWLEVLLFVVGVTFIALELFVIPGLGIFGIGGLLLVVTSLVLATQTFIIPRNSEELAQLPKSLGMVVGALSGLVIAMVVMRRYLPNAPLVKRLMLEPPQADSDVLGGAGESASRVSVGARGTTITRLLPTGKAKFSGQVIDVISDGEIVDPKQTVEVIEAVGNRVVVKQIG